MRRILTIFEQSPVNRPRRVAYAHDRDGPRLALHQEDMRDAKYLDVAKLAASKRRASVPFASWARGYGVIRHSDQTQVRIATLQETLEKEGTRGDGLVFVDLLVALDHLTSAGMWMVIHQTYARRMYLDGRMLRAADFKRHPEGHARGALHMTPAYAGYLAANVVDGMTRGWLMGEGRCVAAVDALNLLVGNARAAHARRYPLTDEGLARYARDFYSCEIRADGRQDSPLGSHVNAHTAGGIFEGGYPGLAELQYVHMPLLGERLVAFLSTDACEEPLGGGGSTRLWRAEDSGLVAPILVGYGNGHTSWRGSDRASWLVERTRCHGLDPILFDGRDPAAFLWAIVEIERRLQREARRVAAGELAYPIRLPCGIADTPDSTGLPGEGIPLAHHRLPLLPNPKENADAAARFNTAAAKLWVSAERLEAVRSEFSRHDGSGRPRERDVALANRVVTIRGLESPGFVTLGPEPRLQPANWTLCSPMVALDAMFSALVLANPGLRPRVGDPNEMRFNWLSKTLATLKFRAANPDRDRPAATSGAVITSRSHEAIAAAALANRGGINLIHSSEALGVKMLGVLREEIHFSSHCREHGRAPRWLSVPVLLTSHTWESGHDGGSHQDPGLVESLLGEPFDVSRVHFPPDTNGAIATLERVYETRGQLWAMVVPKAVGIPNLLGPEEARQLVADGALALPWAGYQPTEPRVILTAIGAYQLGVVLRASRRLANRRIPHSVVYLAEPGRLREPKTAAERTLSIDPALVSALYPEHVPPRLFVTHTRPEAILGLLGPLHTGSKTAALGFANRRGTLGTPGMLFVNGTSWAHCVRAAARLLNLPETALLEPAECNALEGKASPHGPVIPTLSI